MSVFKKDLALKWLVFVMEPSNTLGYTELRSETSSTLGYTELRSDNISIIQ